MSLPLYTVSDAKFKSQKCTTVKFYGAPVTHHTQIVFNGAAYEYSYLLLMYLLTLLKA